MRHTPKKLLTLLLAVLLVLSLSGCGGNQSSSGSNPVASLKFSDSVSLDRIEALNGQKVTIVGYMATMSPISGKYMYLMNMPYQSCPFCVPNTTQLANTIAVYAPDGKTFDYTDQAIQVTGTLVMEDMVDEFGYAYNYRISNASYETVDLSTISEDYALWQAIATDGIVSELNAMFDYLHFLCQWTYYQGGYTDEDGNEITFFMYPGDVTGYLEDNGPYGYADKYADSYFPGLIARIRAISADQLEDLVAIVEKSKTAADAALEALHTGAYTYDEEADQFTLNEEEALYQLWYDAYLEFSMWMGRWEL